ncbi:MAG: nucleoside hydrolase [Anaerolineae bacterium]|nr:nucleoside hydrolase [Anaerolineae bacterium]
MTTKILLDTDIGSDIDDALCLAYLLAQPECELLGITTVTGEAEKRAMLSSVLCQAAGRDVPIYPGAEAPLLIPQQQPRCPQAAALNQWAHNTNFPPGQAIEFMAKTIRQQPGEIVLLTIGPLTNIALLFKTHPEIPSLLKALVMMAGVFTNRLAGVGPLEWNAKLDPHATAIVYRTPVAVHRSIGLDVTSQVTMNQNEVRQRFRAGLLRPVYDFAQVWFEQKDSITFHDPLAATTIFDGQICTFERGNVNVELASARLAGLTHWTPAAANGQHEIALQVDKARFLAHYFSMFE